MVIDAYFWWALLKVCCLLGSLGISAWAVYRLMTWNNELTLLAIGGIMAFGFLISAANLTANVDRQANSESAHD